MTPQERQLVSNLFDRLSSLENSPRDADAERVITDGFRRAPNAAYALVQTVLVQDEALKRAEAHIRELEGGAQADQGGFLDSMREVFLGRTQQGGSRGSVPSIGGAQQKWNSGQVGGFGGGAQQQPYQQNYPQQEPQRGGSGGSFLGTAAAAATGVIGGSILFNSLGSMFGNRGQAFASPSDGERGGSPWGGDASKSDLARDAGFNDIGGRGNDGDRGGASSLFGNDNNDGDYDDSDFADSGDSGGGDSSDA